MTSQCEEKDGLRVFEYHFIGNGKKKKKKKEVILLKTDTNSVRKDVLKKVLSGY